MQWIISALIFLICLWIALAVVVGAFILIQGKRLNSLTEEVASLKESSVLRSEGRVRARELT